MKKLIMLLIVIAGVYGVIGNALVESGSKSINATHVKLAALGE